MTEPIAVLHQTPREAIVIKPAGLSVELPRLKEDSMSLIAWARRRWPAAAPRLPHRLDRIARGLVVIALDPEAAAFHARMVAAGRWGKHYLARVASDPDDSLRLVGRHGAFLKERGRRTEIVRSGGRPARLEVLAAAEAPERPGQSHLLIRLETGRRHQIRAMLAHLGAPIAGDPIYGAGIGRRGDEAIRSRSPEQGAPYLEHAVLELPLASDDRAPTVFWQPEDARRERLAESMRGALTALVDDLRGGRVTVVGASP
ncbi:MAG TPA: RNA pseudouridine synthase [Phycisphaerales bacterium]|nr:RNA pseudouridine synthase [Phycisphaerales bacterium]HMP37121.1 RNA pseudouridine synthase [Phycisphaerales bacterium]